MADAGADTDTEIIPDPSEEEVLDFVQRSYQYAQKHKYLVPGLAIGVPVLLATLVHLMQSEPNQHRPR